MISDFFEPKQAPIYLVLCIQGARWISSYIWAKGESTEALAARLTSAEHTVMRLADSLEERRGELNAMRAHVYELSGELTTALRIFRVEPPDGRRRS